MIRMIFHIINLGGVKRLEWHTVVINLLIEETPSGSTHLHPGDIKLVLLKPP